jgi:4-alpha-glucanotransferase
MRGAPGAVTGTLGELASLCGLETRYVGSDGQTQAAEEDVVLALLRSLGVPIDRAADAPDALRQRRLARAERVIEPVLVLRGGHPGTFTATLPQRVDPRRAWLAIELEDGTTRQERLLPVLSGAGVDGDGPVTGPGDQVGRRFHRYRVHLNQAGAEPIPPGYHTVHVEADGAPHHARASATALLISAPGCPEASRGWGIFMPLHALRTDEDWGTGSYTDLAELGQWVSELGGTMVGGLPLYPSFLEPPADPSPYRPVSRLAYNELYIDPGALPELAQSPTALALLESGEFTGRIAAARASSLVEYEEVSRLRRQVLEPMAQALLSSDSARHEELRAFGRAHPELVAYARFRAALDRRGRGDPGAAGDWEEAVEPGVGYHLYCQWAAAQQLHEAGRHLPLYADLPVGVHPEGFDPSWSPASFLREVHGGAPPDAFFGGGQDWGFPPLHPERMREDGYRYLAGVLGRAFRHASHVRVDHIMGLQRMYVIPEGADARHGAYVNYRADEMHALVSLEAHRAGAVVVGEDLGTVPEEVRQRMAADRMLRSWVFQFESTATLPLPEPPRPVLASLGTHDLPRFGTWLWGLDIDEDEELGRLQPEEASARRSDRDRRRTALLDALGLAGLPGPEVTDAALLGCLAHLAQSEADLVLVDLEELWDERQPQNRPGTGPEAGNWRRRSARTLAQARADRGVGALLARLDRLRRGDGVGDGDAA